MEWIEIWVWKENGCYEKFDLKFWDEESRMATIEKDLKRVLLSENDWFIKNFNWAVWMLDADDTQTWKENGSYEKVFGKKKVERQRLKQI